MAEFSKEFLEKTIEVWQPLYDHPLTLEDARRSERAAFNLLVEYAKRLESSRVLQASW